MKTELDFKLVPLDKWVDLYNALDNSTAEGPFWKAWKDVKKAAEYQVKEEADYNKEIAEAVTTWFSKGITKETEDAAYTAMYGAINARKKMLGIVDESVSDDKQSKRENELAPVEDIIK